MMASRGLGNDRPKSCVAIAIRTDFPLPTKKTILVLAVEAGQNLKLTLAIAP